MIGASFEKGDIVTWVSQAGGSVREKKGKLLKLFRQMENLVTLFATDTLIFSKELV